MQQPCDLPTLQADFTDYSNVNLNIVDVVAFLMYIATFCTGKAVRVNIIMIAIDSARHSLPHFLIDGFLVWKLEIDLVQSATFFE